MAGKAIGNVDESLRGRENSVVIPVSASIASADPDSAFVWVVDAESSTVSKRKIFIAEISEQGAVVTEGLQAGEWVVTGGANYLTEGQPVILPGT